MVYIMVPKRLVANALFFPGGCKKLLNGLQKNEEKLQEIYKYPIQAPIIKAALMLQLKGIKKALDDECRGSEIITLY